MFKAHPSFDLPAPDTQIWRYMDLARFVSLLDEKALYFSRLDQFEDKFEGSLPRPNIGRIKVLPSPGFSKKDADDLMLVHQAGFRKLVKEHRQNILVNCWHVNTHESVAMWDLYGKRDAGIAIQSTVRRLCASLAAEPRDIHIGSVRYLDYEKAAIPMDNLFYPYLSKRLSYQHEHELRAFLHVEDAPDHGSLILTNLQELVEQVFVHPAMQQWFARAVDAVLKRFGLSKTVQHSNLSTEPLF